MNNPASSTSTRIELWAALDTRIDGVTYAHVLAALQLTDDKAAQTLAAEHALQQGAFGNLLAFVRWFEENWDCTLHLTAALGHEPWMLQSSEGIHRTPKALARVALRQIKATLCANLHAMDEKWQMWNALPEMGYHTKVIHALLGQAKDANKATIREKLRAKLQEWDDKKHGRAAAGDADDDDEYDDDSRTRRRSYANNGPARGRTNISVT